MDDYEMLRYMNTCPIQDLIDILSRNDDESELNFRSRVMGHLIPETYGFLSLIYIEYKIIESDLFDVLISFTLEEPKNLIPSLVQYSEETLLKFLSRITARKFLDTHVFIFTYITYIGRALYRINKDSHIYILEKCEFRYIEEHLKKGICIECVLADDEKIFKLYSPNTTLISDISRESVKIKSTKYIKIFIKNTIFTLFIKKHICHLNLLRDVKNQNLYCSVWIMKAIIEYANWTILDFFDFLMCKNFDFLEKNRFDTIKLYQCFYILGMSVDKISEMVEGRDWLTSSYLKWIESLKIEDV